MLEATKEIKISIKETRRCRGRKSRYTLWMNVINSAKIKHKRQQIKAKWSYSAKLYSRKLNFGYLQRAEIASNWKDWIKSLYTPHHFRQSKERERERLYLEKPLFAPLSFVAQSISGEEKARCICIYGSFSATAQFPLKTSHISLSHRETIIRSGALFARAIAGGLYRCASASKENNNLVYALRAPRYGPTAAAAGIYANAGIYFRERGEGVVWWGRGRKYQQPPQQQVDARWLDSALE